MLGSEPSGGGSNPGAPVTGKVRHAAGQAVPKTVGRDAPAGSTPAPSFILANMEVSPNGKATALLRPRDTDTVSVGSTPTASALEIKN